MSKLFLCQHIAICDNCQVFLLNMTFWSSKLSRLACLATTSYPNLTSTSSAQTNWPTYCVLRKLLSRYYPDLK